MQFRTVFPCSIKKIKFKIHKTKIFPFVLHGHKTWLVTLSEEQGLRVFENKMLRTIFGTTRDETGNEENCIRSSIIISIRTMKSRQIRWVVHITILGEIRPLRRPRCR
jgi:hypothetical protein